MYGLWTVSEVEKIIDRGTLERLRSCTSPEKFVDENGAGKSVWEDLVGCAYSQDHKSSYW